MLNNVSQLHCGELLDATLFLRFSIFPLERVVSRLCFGSCRKRNSSFLPWKRFIPSCRSQGFSRTLMEEEKSILCNMGGMPGFSNLAMMQVYCATMKQHGNSGFYFACFRSHWCRGENVVIFEWSWLWEETMHYPGEPVLPCPMQLSRVSLSGCHTQSQFTSALQRTRLSSATTDSKPVQPEAKSVTWVMSVFNLYGFLF